MATIGSITVAFETDITKLVDGVAEAVSEVESLKKEIESVGSEVSLRVSVDSRSAASQIAKLKTAADSVADVSSTVRVKVDGLADVDRLIASISGIDNKSVRLAVDASGLGSVDELKSALAGINSKSITAAVDASGLGSVDELRSALDGVQSKSVTAAVEASGLGSVDELRSALDGVQSKSVTAAVDASGLSSVDELRSALDGIQSKSVTAAVEASGLGSVDELRSALDGVQSKSVTAAVEASGLGSVDELRSALDGIESKSVAAAVEASGLGSVDELRSALDGVQSKSVTAAVEASGLGSVEELKSALAGINSKTITAAVEASGLGSVDELRSALDGVQSKSVTAAVEASGLGSVDELRSALDGIESKSVTAAVEASGLGSVDELRSALDGIQSKSVTAAVEASGLGSVDELRSALDGVQSKSVTAAVEASGLGSVDELKAAIDGIQSKSVTAAVEASGLSSVEELKAALDGLQSEPASAIAASAYFQSLRDEITGATEDIRQFNTVLAAQVAVANASLNKLNVEKSIRIDADVTDLKTSIEAADKLSAAVSLTADTSAVSSAVEGISTEKPVEVEVKADTKSLSTATGVVTQFASTAGELISRTGEDVVKGAERFDQYRSSATAMAGGVTEAYAVIRNASNQTASAVNAIGDAATAISKAGQEGFKGISSAAEATVVAVGRSYDAAETLVKTYSESLPAAASASVAGFRAFVTQLGGISTLSRAAGGSAAATAVTVGSLAGAFASAATSIGVYAAVVTAAKVASSGMTEEAQAYVERSASYVGALAGVAAGASATTSAYRLVAGALYSSSTATQFLQRVLQGLGQGITSIVANSASLINRLMQIQTVLSLVTAASNEKTTGVGFAALAARVAVTSVMFGALAGGVRAYAAGTAVAAGVTGGASTAIAGLAATFPLAAVGAMAAAVATGKFFHALETLSVATQSLDQMAERFGTTTQEIEKLKLAADNTQVSMRMLGKAQQSFYQNLSKIKSGQFNTESVREAKIAFDKLGISAEEIKNKKPDEAFRLVAEELSKVEDAAKRTSIAMDLFGRMGAMILPALKELGEIEQDFKRIGGALNSLDTKRLLDVEASFDRLAFAGKSLSRTLLIPFVELQKGFNNFAADLKGGVSTALAPLASMLADVSKPLAIIIEMVGRVINIFLRMVAVILQVAAASQAFAAFAAIFEGIKAGFDAAMKPLEALIAGAAELASGFAAFMRPAAEFTGIFSLFGVVIRGFGAAVGVVLASLAQLAIYIAVGAAAWGIYTVAIGLASAVSLFAAVNFAIAWAAALGPITIAVVALAAIGAAVTYLAAGLVAAGKWVYGLAKSFLGFKDAPEKIDAARASVEELAEASRFAAEFKGAKAPAFDEVKKSVTEARGEINGLIIESARYGSEGAAAAKAAQEGFGELQQKLSEGRITLEEFDEQTKKNTKNLEDNLKAYKDDSPAIALKKNLELYKQLDDAAKAATKSTRDIGAGTVIDDKFFPTSEAIKAKAAQYKSEYIKALEEIKKKQQEGFFSAEIKQKKDNNQSDFDAGRISKDQFETVKLELDSTNAQEQASIAAEEVKREFDRKNKIEIELDTSFAEGIRKSLDDAFLSPVQKFEKELGKISKNESLTAMEKTMASADLRKKATESLVGKDGQTTFQERTRDVKQAAAAGLIGEDKLKAELQKASEDFAAAVGVTKTPFEAFSSSLDNIAKQFGFAGQPIDVVREKLKGNAEQLAMFDRALKESRDNLLASLGIEKTPQQVFDEQIKKINEAVNATDDNKKITPEQAEQAKAVATRKRDEALGAGADVAGQLKERQAKINESFGGGKDPAKLAVAQNKLDIDKRSAAGLDATPAQALQAGIDKINDAFGEAGKGTKEYDEAIKKNRDTVLQSIGVERSAIAVRQEAEAKIASLALTAGEAAQAEAKKNDSFMSALGITKTPFEQFSSAIDDIAAKFDMAGKPLDEVREKLKGNAKDLALLERAVKQARDAFLADLGIEKTPQQVFDEQMKKIDEAANSTDKEKRITSEQADQARTNATRKRDESLGGESAADFGGRVKEQRAKIEEAYGKDGANDPEKFKSAMRKLNETIPGAEQQSPVQKFQEDLAKLKASFGEGTPEFEQGKKNLQAQLQDDLKPALDSTKQDRRGVEASDSRSKGGVDTFFRILRGNDNPSLKAQLEVARNTKILAEASKNKDAAPAIAQLSPGK